MTPSERRALWFLVAVALLGIGVRAIRSMREPKPESTSVVALDEQIDRVQEAKAARATKPVRRPTRKAARRSAPSLRTGATAGIAPPQPVVAISRARVDVDRASEAELVALPYIGPSIARRIIDDRAKNGAFGCLATLEPINGVGPALLKRIDSLVTFSGSSPRSSSCRR